MANNPETRCYSIWIDNQKVAEMTTSSLDIDFARKPLKTNSGIIFAKGIISGKCTFNCVALVGGSSPDLLNIGLSQKTVGVSIPIEGGALGSFGVLSGVGYKGDVAEGTLMGDWSLEFDTPVLQKA